MIKENLKSALMPVYKRSSIVMERGEGVYLYGDNGKKYLDFAGGIAVNSLGHCHPHLVKALEKQANKLWHVSNMYTIEPQERLAKRLADSSFADLVFFCSTGVEAVETGIKMMRKYHDETGNPDKYRIITIEGAFHGRSLTAISAAAKESGLKGFEPAVDGFDNIPFNDIYALRNAITDETAGILLEPIQGEGGIRVNSKEYLQEVRKIADENGILLMFDEVQCGVGRLGKLFAYELFDVLPDIVSIAKGIGGGFPLGSCLATEKAACGMQAGTHGSTFGGNPLATTVGNAVMDILNDEIFLKKVEEIGEQLTVALNDLQAKYPTFIKDVRGIGLMQGIQIDADSREFLNKLREAGLLTVAAGTDVIRVLPPLIIDENHIKEAIEILDKTISSIYV